MSHIPQRKEKDCLNCGTIVQGRYCHVCGQENIVPKETFWHMVTHFFYDITHFDSNFFTTVKDLLFKPGFLSKEYMRGRRASYLHPIKMYVFTSAIFFLLFFSFFAKSSKSKDTVRPLSQKERTVFADLVQKRLAKDSTDIELKEKLALLQDSSRVPTNLDVMNLDLDPGNNKGGFTVNFGSTFRSFEAYDSAQKKLPPSERDGWLTRRFYKIIIDIDQKFKENPVEAGRKLTDSILHKLPYLLLVSLPFFALILRLVYIRRKQFYYADHGVFTIHLYVFSFVMLVLVFLSDELTKVVKSELPDFLIALCFLTLLVYLYKAMRTFYGQSWWKTFIKYLIVAILSLLMMSILLLFFFFFSAATL